MTGSNDDISLEAVAADIRKVGEEALRSIKAEGTPPGEIGTLRACGSGLIEESYEVAEVIVSGRPGPNVKANTLASWYRQWRRERPLPNSPFPPRTPTS